MNKKCTRDRNAMVKKVSLNISNDSYKELASLSDFYNQDVEDIIIKILNIVGMNARRIINLSKEYKVPVELVTMISDIFDAGNTLIYDLFDKILENLDFNKGLYSLEDLGIDLDENISWFYYVALDGCNLKIDTFHLEIHPGLKYLDTESYIDGEKLNDEVLEKLYDLIESVEVPEEFHELENYEIKIGGDEEFLKLKIDCVADSLNYLPSLTIMSEFVDQIFKKVGI